MQDLLVSLWRELEATVFFITHDIPEAVYLGDRVFIFTPSPGTIAHQLAVAPPDRPAGNAEGTGLPRISPPCALLAGQA